MNIRTNARAVAAGIRRFGRSLKNATKKGLDIWARETAAAIKKVAPTGKTRNMRRAIHGRGMMVGGVATAVIRLPVKYAPYLECGTGLWGPHHKKYKIAPVRRKALRWIASAGVAQTLTPMMRRGKVVGTRIGKAINVSKYVFAKWVMHPGIKPRPFFFPTIRARYQYLPRDVRNALRREVQSAASCPFVLRG